MIPTPTSEIRFGNCREHQLTTVRRKSVEMNDGRFYDDGGSIEQ
jgi:hypothetical protein